MPDCRHPSADTGQTEALFLGPTKPDGIMHLQAIAAVLGHGSQAVFAHQGPEICKKGMAHLRPKRMLALLQAKPGLILSYLPAGHGSGLWLRGTGCDHPPRPLGQPAGSSGRPIQQQHSDQVSRRAFISMKTLNPTLTALEVPGNILRPCFAQTRKLLATPLCAHASGPFLPAVHMARGVLRSAWCQCKLHCLALWLCLPGACLCLQLREAVAVISH